MIAKQVDTSRSQPPLNRHRADAILRTTFNNPIAVRHINQDIALTIEKPDNMQFLENKATMLVEDAFTVLDIADLINKFIN